MADITPGKWIVVHDEITMRRDIRAMHPQGNYWIAQVIPNQPPGASEAANARLIAAAPTLLDWMDRASVLMAYYPANGSGKQLQDRLMGEAYRVRQLLRGQDD